MLLLILVGLIVTAALGYVYREEVDSAVKKGLTEGLWEYGNDTTYTTEIDFMQSHVSFLAIGQFQLSKKRCDCAFKFRKL